MAERAGLQFDPKKVVVRIAELGKVWSDRDAAATLSEDTIKANLAAVTLRHMTAKGCSKAQAELEALASDEHRAQLEKAAQDRKLANDAKIDYDCAMVYARLLQSANANKREEMRFSHMG